MTTITRKQVCACKNCGNEAEMVVTCNLPQTMPQPPVPAANAEVAGKVKATATCSHCGNEADMWIDP
jgi:transcription elongation factor Elf1